MPLLLSFPGSQVTTETIITSNPIIISGINAPITLQVNNGEYSINGGPTSNHDTRINNGDSIIIQHLSSPDFFSETQTLFKNAPTFLLVLFLFLASAI